MTYYAYYAGRVQIMTQRRHVDVIYRPGLCWEDTKIEKSMSENATDWIKPAIQSLLKETYQGHDVQVNVENVPYGMWIWDDRDLEHVHVTSRELKATLGSGGLEKFRRNLVWKSLTWDQLRVVAGRPTP